MHIYHRTMLRSFVKESMHVAVLGHVCESMNCLDISCFSAETSDLALVKCRVFTLQATGTVGRNARCRR